jgi:hypothetical protein
MLSHAGAGLEPEHQNDPLRCEAYWDVKRSLECAACCDGGQLILMLLLFQGCSVVSQFRSACSRRRTPSRLIVVLAGLCIREDFAGNTTRDSRAYNAKRMLTKQPENELLGLYNMENKRNSTGYSSAKQELPQACSYPALYPEESAH